MAAGKPHAAVRRSLHGVHAGQCRTAGHLRFVGEFLSLIGTFKNNIAVATIATFGVILSAAYALWLYRKMISAR